MIKRRTQLSIRLQRQRRLLLRGGEAPGMRLVNYHGLLTIRRSLVASQVTSQVASQVASQVGSQLTSQVGSQLTRSILMGPRVSPRVISPRVVSQRVISQRSIRHESIICPFSTISTPSTPSIVGPVNRRSYFPKVERCQRQCLLLLKVERRIAMMTPRMINGVEY
jgi:hypothetical protein